MSDLITKAIATIEPGTDDADTANGTFHVILSAQSLDRDGDTLLSDGWELPLPEHITFDTDHGMSVASTVGSGAPAIEDDGNLHVRGSYSSIPRGQEIRTLVNEGHIRTTSVAFLTKKSTKAAGGKTRELLNGAFVAIPSNTDAKVLSSKAFDALEAETAEVAAKAKVSKGQHLQSAHDSLVGAGAMCAGTKAATLQQIIVKSIVGSLDALRDRVSAAIKDEYGRRYAWIRGIVPAGDPGGVVIFEAQLAGLDTYEYLTYSQTYTDDGSTVTLTGTATEVDIQEIVVPAPDAELKSVTDRPSPAAGTGDDDGLAELQTRALAIRANALVAQ